MRHRGKRVVHLSTVHSLAGIALLLAVVLVAPVAAPPALREVEK